MSLLIKCHGCGKTEAAELIDTKDDGTGNFTVMHCIACYGPGWTMMAHSHASLSRLPELAPRYAAWIEEAKVEDARRAAAYAELQEIWAERDRREWAARPLEMRMI